VLTESIAQQFSGFHGTLKFASVFPGALKPWIGSDTLTIHAAFGSGEILATTFVKGQILSPVINATSKQDKTIPLPLYSFADKLSAKADFWVISVDFRVA
jgi:hypothetical protein